MVAVTWIIGNVSYHKVCPRGDAARIIRDLPKTATEVLVIPYNRGWEYGASQRGSRGN